MKITILGAIAVAVLQVGCANQDAVVQYCTDNSADCVSKYIQVAGGAAATGESQVADSSATVSTGQVPSTSLLPASITNAQIQSKAAEVSKALQAMSGAEATSATSSSVITTSSIQAEPEPVEVDVYRLDESSTAMGNGEISGSSSAESIPSSNGAVSAAQ